MKLLVFLLCFFPIFAYSFQSQEEQAKELVHNKQFAKAGAIYEALLKESPDNPDLLLSLGRIKVALNQKKVGIALYIKALEIDPQRVDIRTALGYAYLFDEQLGQSTNTFQQALKEEPENSAALAGLGIIAVRSHQDKEAEQLFQKALNIDPDEPIALFHLASLRYRQKNYKEAIQLYESLLKQDPDNEDALAGMASIAKQQNQSDLAEHYYQRVLDINPKNEAALFFFGSYFSKKKNYDKALQYFAKLVEIDPSNLDYKEAVDVAREALLVDKAKELQRVNDKRGAEQIYRQLIEHSSSKTKYYLLLGRMYIDQGNPDKAIDLYKEALALFPSEIEIKNALAFQYVNKINEELGISPFTPKPLENVRIKENYEKAKSLFESVLAQDPKDPDAIAGLSRIIQMIGKADSQDVVYFESLLEKNPTNPDLLFHFGRMKMALDKKQAIQLYLKALQTDPKREDIRVALGYAYLFDNQWDESKKVFRQVVHEDAANSAALAGLGALDFKQSKYKEAEDLFQRALKNDANQPTALFYLANLRLKQKNYQEAEKLYTRLLKVEPHNDDALAGLARIAAQQNQLDKAEQYDLEALDVNPNNEAALEFFASLFLKQKNYPRALQLYTKLLQIAPDNSDYQEGLLTVQEAPIEEQAEKLQQSKDYAGAAVLYRQLIELSPKRSKFYLRLGVFYVSQNRRDEAIELYAHGLALIPHDKDLSNALAYQYLNKALSEVENGPFDESYFPLLCPKIKYYECQARSLFENVLAQDSNDALALAGLGRLTLLDGYPELAENFYFKSIAIDPKSTVSLSYLASLQTLEKKYFTAHDTYRYLLEIETSDNEIRKSYQDLLKIKNPALDIAYVYEEENEKDLNAANIRVWTARLKNYGTTIGLGSAVRDRLKIYANIQRNYIVLLNLLTHLNIYGVQIVQPDVGFTWNESPYFSFGGGCQVAFYRQYRRSTFKTNTGHYILPYFRLSYAKNYHSFTLETVGDALLVARNFNSFQSTLIARQFLNAIYEYDLGKKRAIGFAGTYGVYKNKIKDNRYEYGSAWLRLTPPCLWKNLSLKYQFTYGRFDVLTVDYYTYRPQISHYLKIDFTKAWLNDHLVTEAGYSHCWQRSFESGQVITVVPVSQFHWVNRRINAAYARLSYLFGDTLTLTMTGTYSKDNFDYTTASFLAQLHVRF